MFLICLLSVAFVLFISKYSRVLTNLWHKISSYDDRLDKDKNKQLVVDKIVLADTLEKSDHAVNYLRRNLSDGVLGFDCEWVNEGPVSLLQLATSTGICTLFRLEKIGFVPPKLKELLSNESILKVGVAPFEDGRKLTRDYGCRVFGTLDLRKFAEYMDIQNQTGLASLSMHYLKIELNKVSHIRCGNWNAKVLTDEQISYAASDAIASVQIYYQMQKRIKEKQGVFVNFFDNFIKQICPEKKTQGDFVQNVPRKILDSKYRVSSSKIDNNQNSEKNNSTEINQRQVSAIKSKITSIPTRKESLYNHCYLQAPDGEVLCIFDRKKGNWYVKNGLGKIVENNPLTVRLNFEPVSRGYAEVDKYYTQARSNQCVVCGSLDKFIKKNIVPHEYRKYFPLVMKVHQSHDVLLLCPFCHVKSNRTDQDLRMKLAKMCNAPLKGSSSKEKKKEHQEKRKYLMAVKALMDDSIVLPEKRRKELEARVQEYSKNSSVGLLSSTVIGGDDDIGDIKITLEEKRASHGQVVVQYFTNTEGGLVTLERMWREHFLETMKPQHLPPLWSVNHNQERLKIRQIQNRIQPEDAKVAGIMK